MLSEKRDTEAATTFLKAIRNNGIPEKVVRDKRGINPTGISNILLMLFGLFLIEILQVKYLNNIVKQDHQFIQKITKPMMGFKAFHSAQETLAGIETAHRIRKR